MNQEIENRGCATEAFGRKWLTCRICGEHANNNIYKVKEMMYGTKEEFNYFVCEKCKCMQIEEVPENLEQYYHNDVGVKSPYSTLKILHKHTIFLPL